MRTVIILALLLCMISCRYQEEACDCGKLHAYYEDTNECIQIPTQSQQGYIEYCDIYQPYRSYKDGNLKWDCKQCKPSFHYNGADCVETKYNNCLQFQEQFISQQYLLTCQQCESQFYVDQSDGKCKKQIDNIKNCTKYSPYGPYCIECEEDYYLLGSTCFKAFIKLQNCKIQSAQQCLQCKQGYQIVNGLCYKPQDLYKNCELLQEDKCIKCEPNYYISNSFNYCIPYPQTEKEGKINHCSKYTNARTFGQPQQFEDHPICVQCDEGYSLRDGGTYCVQGQENNVIQNCAIFGYRGECKMCDYNSITVRETSYQIDNDIIECRICPKVPNNKSFLSLM